MEKDKQCFACDATENLSILQRFKNGNIQYQCRPCNRARTKKYYDRCKQLVFDHYGWVCACCGESNPLFLTIDHIKNDGYMYKWANGDRLGGVHLYQKLVKEKYPEYVQTLCMNCNFGKRMNNGICPHKTEMVL